MAQLDQKPCRHKQAEGEEREPNPGPDHPKTRRTNRNRRRSPLLRLPAELRNHVYEHVFKVSVIRIDVDVASLYWDSNYKIMQREVLYLSYPRKHLALIEACRQTYAEARLLPLVLNDIHATPKGLNVAMKHHFNQIQLDAITKIHVRIDRRDVRCARRLRHWRLLPYVHTSLRNMSKFAKLKVLAVQRVALKGGVDSEEVIQWLKKEMAKPLYKSGIKYVVEISIASSDS